MDPEAEQPRLEPVPADSSELSCHFGCYLSAHTDRCIENESMNLCIQFTAGLVTQRSFMHASGAPSARSLGLRFKGGLQCLSSVTATDFPYCQQAREDTHAVHSTELSFAHVPSFAHFFHFSLKS